MSISVMTALWKTCLYQGNTLNVLLAMADWAEDDGGDIFPGIETLAAKARASVRTTQMALRTFESDQVVERIANPRGGRGRVTEYKIDLERVQELQALHEQECPDCEFCAAKRRSAEKRVQHRAQRVQASAEKGADRGGKGAKPREHIDNTHQEPSDTPQHSPAPNGAESEKVASLVGQPERFEEFRSAIAETWPGGFVRDDEARTRSAFERATKLVQADTLIACARAHGAFLRDKQARRGHAAGEMLTKLPSNWLKERCWHGYVRQIDANEAAARDVALKMGRVQAAVGPDLIRLFRETLRMPDAWIAALDGIGFEAGPPPVLTCGAAQRQMLNNHVFSLQRHLGEELRIITVGSARQSA